MGDRRERFKVRVLVVCLILGVVPPLAVVLWLFWGQITWTVRRMTLAPPESIVHTTDRLGAAEEGEVLFYTTNHCSVLIPKTKEHTHLARRVNIGWPLFQVPKTRIDVTGPDRTLHIREILGQERGLSFGGTDVPGSHFRVRTDWTVEVSSTNHEPVLWFLAEQLREVEPQESIPSGQ